VAEKVFGGKSNPIICTEIDRKITKYVLKMTIVGCILDIMDDFKQLNTGKNIDNYI
jgi:hypothetical protein